MELVYVISSPDSAANDIYKIGRHTGPQKKLLARYATYIIPPVIYFSHPTSSGSALERLIFDRFNDHRIERDEDDISEWVQLDLNTILQGIMTIIAEHPELRYDPRVKKVKPESEQDRDKIEKIPQSKKTKASKTKSTKQTGERSPDQAEPDNKLQLKIKKMIEDGVRDARTKAELEKIPQSEDQAEPGPDDGSTTSSIIIRPHGIELPVWVDLLAKDANIVTKIAGGPDELKAELSDIDGKIVLVMYPDEVNNHDAIVNDLNALYSMCFQNKIRIIFIFMSEIGPVLFYSLVDKTGNIFGIVRSAPDGKKIIGFTDIEECWDIFGRLCSYTGQTRFLTNQTFREFNSV